MSQISAFKFPQIRANVTAYVLAYHHIELEQPREKPSIDCLMGKRFEGSFLKDKDTGKLGWAKVSPFFQLEDIAMLSLNTWGEL
jgi:hypothetical protein